MVVGNRKEAKAKGVVNAQDKDRHDAKDGKDIGLETGAVYRGQWDGSQRHGHGLLKWPDGGAYEGEFNEGWAHGKGRFTHANGDIYVGEWVNDRAHGHGKFLHKDGDSYVGQWQ